MVSTTHTVTLLFLPMHRFATQKWCIPYPITLRILLKYNFSWSTRLKSKIPMTKNRETLGQDKQKQKQPTNISPHKFSNPSHASSFKLRKKEIHFPISIIHLLCPAIAPSNLPCTMLALKNTSFRSQIPPHQIVKH